MMMMMMMMMMMIIIIIVTKPLLTVASLHCGCGGYKHSSINEVTWRQSRYWSTRSIVVDQGSVAIWRRASDQWKGPSVSIGCAGTSGLSRATWPNSDALNLDRNGVNFVVVRNCLTDDVIPPSNVQESSQYIQTMYPDEMKSFLFCCHIRVSRPKMILEQVVIFWDL